MPTGDPPTPERPASPLGSVDKALLALDVLGEHGVAGLPLADLARLVGVNKTTLHRTLAALRHRGYVEQETSSGRYRLGPAALALSTAYLAEENLPALLHEPLTLLSAEVDELVHLGVLAGDQVVYVDKVEPARPVRVWSAVGRRVPAQVTALGRAMLAHRPPVAGLDVTARAAVGAARERGWAEEVEENEPGISCVAVPLLRGGLAVAAVSVTAPAERLGGPRRAEVAQVVRDVVGPRLPATLTLPRTSPAPGPTL